MSANYKVAIDTETTGLKISEGHRIIEIAVVLMDGDIPTENVFHYYVNPNFGISQDAFKVHGISNEFLSDKKTFENIAGDFLDFIKDYPLIIHNAKFDLSFLNMELRRSGYKKINNTIIDTMEMAKELLPGSGFSLSALCKKFKIKTTERKLHGALIDAKLLSLVYHHLSVKKRTSQSLFSFTKNEEKVAVEDKEKNVEYLVLKPSDEDQRLFNEMCLKIFNKTFD